MTLVTPENKQESNVIQEKVDNSSVQTNISVQSNANVAPETEKQEDPNWRAFREARKKDRLDKEAAEKRAHEKAAEAEALKAAMEAILNKPQSNQQQQNSSSDYQEEETQEQIIEKKVQAALAQRETQYEQQRIQREIQEYPQKLQKAYPDFNQIVSQENLDYLEYHFPEVARPLQRLNDGYDKWADIYLAVKKFIPNQNSKKDQQKAENNFNKPKSMSSTSVSQSGESMTPSRLEESRKAANWERMQKVLKGLG